MDALNSFIMGTSTDMDIQVAIRLAIVFALIEMLRAICVAMVKGVK